MSFQKYDAPLIALNNPVQISHGENGLGRDVEFLDFEHPNELHAATFLSHRAAVGDIGKVHLHWLWQLFRPDSTGEGRDGDYRITTSCRVSGARITGRRIKKGAGSPQVISEEILDSL